MRISKKKNNKIKNKNKYNKKKTKLKTYFIMKK